MVKPRDTPGIAEEEEVQCTLFQILVHDGGALLQTRDRASGASGAPAVPPVAEGVAPEPEPAERPNSAEAAPLMTASASGRVTVSWNGIISQQ